MDPIMIGIAAVVILVLFAGFFFMKKGKTNTTVDSQTNVKRPKTLAEQQRELELQRQSQQQVPTATTSLPQSTPVAMQTANNTQSAQSELKAAEQLIQSQDYDGAITILRRAVKNHPSQNDLYFALLNTYALAKDYQNFDAFYPEVLSLNNMDITTQANNLKKLVDEEQALNAKKIATTETANTEAEGLDFDGFDFKQDTNKPATTDAFDALHTSGVSMPIVTEAAEPTTSIPSDSKDDLDFDFSLNSSETQTASPVVNASEAKTAQAQANEFSFDDLDFDLPSKETTPPTPVVEAHTEIFAPVTAEPALTTTTATDKNIGNAIDIDSDNDSDFDFDFNLPETSAIAVSPTTPVSQPIAEDAISAPITEKTAASLDDDFDFDFDLATDTTSSPVATPATNSETEAKPEVDLTFDTLETKNPPQNAADATATQRAVANMPAEKNEDIDLTSFDLEDELLLQADAASLETTHSLPVAAPVSNASSAIASEPTLELPEVQAPAQSDSLLISDDMFDFDLDDKPVKAEETATHTIPNAPAATDDILDLSFDEPTTTQSATTDISSNVASNELTTAPVVEDLSAVFAAIKDIDTDTLNVDLAEQYLNLGEFDSAKRLLDEIKDSDNPALLERAESLRQRIA